MKFDGRTGALVRPMIVAFLVERRSIGLIAPNIAGHMRGGTLMNAINGVNEVLGPQHNSIGE